jgi:arylsulfatase A
VIEEIDWSVGEILATLKETGLDRETLVLFTSDNGAPQRRDAASNAPFRGYKFSNWEGGFREPFLARWPGRIPAGSVRLDPACTLDLFTSSARQSSPVRDVRRGTSLRRRDKLRDPYPLVGAMIPPA